MLPALGVVALLPPPASAQTPSPPATRAASNIRYHLTFDSATARRRALLVRMRFEVPSGAPVLISIPAWTPGAYEISNYARKVSSFSATSLDRPAVWDKTDFDTWRIRPAGPGPVELRFEFLADTLDNAMAWARPDFLLVNGTNVLPYPEGMGFDFPAEVGITTHPGWQVLSGLEPGRAAGSWQAGNYHDLVDMPLFIGRIDVDSAQIEGVWHRLGSYPAGQFKGPPRELLWRQLKGLVPAQSKVFGETPWRHYSTLLIFEPSFGGGSALEHQNSHVGIYHPGFIGTPLLASITAHEIFHAWNVKRLRPAELVPYRYDQPQPTTLLWVSEGITDYYADLTLLRGGIIDSLVFLSLTDTKRAQTEDRPAVALEDASLSTWIHPTDGTADIYYDKGSLAGFLLDVLIRDASDNRRSLDDVLRGLYQSTYKRGKGFSTAEWWAAVSEAAGGKSFTDFSARYIDGREPFPWATVGPLAGVRFEVDSAHVVRLGVNTISDSAQVIVTAVTPGSAADEAGIEAGDQLLRVGEIEVKDDDWGAQFRRRYANAEGATLPVLVRRSEADRTFSLKVRKELVLEASLVYDPAASPKAARVRNGILRGITQP